MAMITQYEKCTKNLSKKRMRIMSECSKFNFFIYTIVLFVISFLFLSLSRGASAPRRFSNVVSYVCYCKDTKKVYTLQVFCAKSIYLKC